MKIEFVDILNFRKLKCCRIDLCGDDLIILRLNNNRLCLDTFNKAVEIKAHDNVSNIYSGYNFNYVFPLVSSKTA
jgi:hypothetical protein